MYLNIAEPIFWSFCSIKLIIDMIVLIVHYMEIDELTGSTLRFGKTLFSASHNIFFTSVLTSMYNPRAPALTDSNVSPCIKKYMHEVKEDAKKTEEHFYPALTTVTLPLSPV